MKQQRLSKPYEGDDIKDFINSNKTYHTPSQAFRDAKYSEWFESDPEVSDMKKFTLDLFCCVLPLLLVLLISIYGLFKLGGLL